MMAVFKRIVRDDTGTSSIQYAVVAAAVGVAAFGAFVALGAQSNNNMTDVSESYAEAQQDSIT